LLAEELSSSAEGAGCMASESSLASGNVDYDTQAGTATKRT
jgi:uncharacterized protein (DUF1697 family)